MNPTCYQINDKSTHPQREEKFWSKQFEKKKGIVL